VTKKSTDTSKLDSNNYKEARGERVRYLRETLLGLKRKKFCLRHPIIGEGTLLNWEYARYGGLSMKGAYALQEIFQEEGILNCTIEWLLHGIGETPTLMYTYQHLSHEKDFSTKASIEPEDEKIKKEINLFYIHHPNAIHTIIADDLMQPHYNRGDYVAGIKCDLNNLEGLIRQACIIQTFEDTLLVRKIYPSDKKGRFILKANKSNKTENNESVKILSAAPIIWIRRQVKNSL
jgi:hypothetical protein